MKRKPITRQQLLDALENTAEDAKFLAGEVSNKREDFLSGLRRHKFIWLTKEQTIEYVKSSSFENFPTIPEFKEDVLLNPHLFVWRNSINNSQLFPAPPDAENYLHYISKYNPYYDIFVRFDKEQKTITFALGNKVRTLSVLEHTSWAWRLTKDSIQTSTIDRLEKKFLGHDWDPICIVIGRKALGIKPAI